jgi:hypothetical protein
LKLDVEEPVKKRSGIDISFQNKRLQSLKGHFDELAADHRFHSREQLFEVTGDLGVGDLIMGIVRYF